MTEDPDLTTYTAGPQDPEALAREAVEAMRATGTDRPDVERVLMRGAERHARFVERHGLIPSDRAPEAF